MKVYRIYDKVEKKFVKIGKRTNDLYVSKPLVITTLKRYYNIENVEERFKILEYDLVLKKEGD